MVGLFLRCLDARREGAPLYRHATSEGCNHQAGPSHRQPPLSRTQPLRSGSNRTRWRCRCSPCRRGSGSSHRTPLHQLGGRPRRQLLQRHRRKHRQRNRRTAVLLPRPHQLGGVVGARESSDGAVSSDAAAEAAPSTGYTAAPAASAARAARALASTAGSADDSWAWPISQGRLRFYPRKRVSVRRLPPRPHPIPRSSATCARLAHSRSWGGHSNEGSTLSRPGRCILGRVTSLAL